jgi:hypothetical protein
MSAPNNDGGSAFPSPPSQHSNGFYSTGEGMTLRQYAAIKLRVPESGTDWLDDMIRKSNREYFAAAALQGIISDASVLASLKKDGELVSRSAYHFADAMLKAKEAKP